MLYILYWLTYEQWKQRFDNDTEAIKAALKYIEGKDELSKFTLVKQVPVSML